MMISSRFSLPEALALCIGLAMSGELLHGARPDLVLADFEAGNYGAWEGEGDAFGARPLVGGSSSAIKLKGFLGQGLAGAGPGREAAVGVLLSPPFKVERRFVNFLIWGERNWPAKLGVELLLDVAGDRKGGRAVRAASATESFDPERRLHWRTWEVGELAGRSVRIQVNDQSATGAIAVDHFEQSDAPRGVPSDAAALFRESHRPQYHFTAQAGWLNDANGLLHYQGQWHLFHQHRPPGSAATIWGHAVSDDVLRWRHLPVAIPSVHLDSNFSGSGLVDWTNASGLQRGGEAPLLLFYTLHPDSKTIVNGERKCDQRLAYSTDGGRSFQPYPGNPLLRTADRYDRDPKVFYHAPTRAWFMVLSLSRNNADREHATYGLFRSRDLKSWDLLQEIGPGTWYWECPDFFELPIDGDRKRTKWLLMKGSGDYIVGSFDGSTFRPETEPIRTQWGGSFYGAQTFSDAPEGRRVQIAWMNTGKTNAPNSWPGMPFNQQMSFPRELMLRTTPDGLRVFRLPIPEIARLYTRTHNLPARPLAPGDNALADIHHDLLDIDLEIELQQARQVKLNLRGTEILYEVKDQKLKAFGRTLSLAPTAGKLVLRTLLDRTSIELFGNHGEVTHAGIFFADPANRELVLTAQGGPARIGLLVVHELKSIWSDAVAQP